MKTVRRSVLLLLLVAVAAIFLFTRFWPGPEKFDDRAKLQATETHPAEPTSQFSVPASKPIIRGQARPERVSSANLIAQFKQQFGSGLELKMSPSGCLISVRGNPQQSLPAEGAFSPTETDQARARAQEVLRLASDLLCLDPLWPLGEPLLSNSPVSAQTSYHETRDGLPVLPFGAVSITLGPNGQVLGLDSSYLGGGALGNERKLSADEAREKAMVVFPTGPDYSGKALEGRPIFWRGSTAENGETTVLNAYDFFSHGHQVVVDAGNGTILYKRDRRIE